jgi:acetyl esterase/lipase
MSGRLATRRLLVGSIAVVLLAGCTSGPSLTPGPATRAPAGVPSEAAATPAPTAIAAATPAPMPGVVVTSDLAYEWTNPVVIPGELDVYAPAAAGAWPVVVMFHGAPGGSPKTDRGYEGENARRVAELGFVVFNASWGHLPGSMPAVPDRQWLQANNAQAACAIEFARAHAAEYGGDPSTMIVFGHSGGAHVAATAAFARPEPTAGCPGGATLGAIDALVTWEGNWLLSNNEPDWDGALAADPRVMDAITPWPYLADHRDQKVVMLVSENPGIPKRAVGDPWAADSWLAVRDPSGALRQQLEANGALADGNIGQADADRLLFSVLQAQGNPVSLDVMPGSSHVSLSDAGWKVFLAGFSKAAAKD